MDHTNKHGDSKLLKACTLPLTGTGVVNRIITNLGVLDVVDGGLKIVECAPGVTEDEATRRHRGDRGLRQGPVERAAPFGRPFSV